MEQLLYEKEKGKKKSNAAFVLQLPQGQNRSDHHHPRYYQEPDYHDITILQMISTCPIMKKPKVRLIEGQYVYVVHQFT